MAASGNAMAIVTVGIDLAKSVFAVHGVDGVDGAGKPVLVRADAAAMEGLGVSFHCAQ